MLARLRKSIKEKDAGFTLVELLVVMIIIGILAAIAIPVFLNQRKKAVDTSIKSDIRTVAQEMETTFVDTQAYGGTTTFQSYAALFPSIRVSSNGGEANTILVKKNTAGDGYCIQGWNSKSTADTVTTKAFWWDSKLGGLQNVAAGTAPASGACV